MMKKVNRFILVLSVFSLIIEMFSVFIYFNLTTNEITDPSYGWVMDVVSITALVFYATTALDYFKFKMLIGLPTTLRKFINEK